MAARDARVVQDQVVLGVAPDGDGRLDRLQPQDGLRLLPKLPLDLLKAADRQAPRRDADTGVLEGDLPEVVAVERPDLAGRQRRDRGRPGAMRDDGDLAEDRSRPELCEADRAAPARGLDGEAARLDQVQLVAGLALDAD